MSVVAVRNWPSYILNDVPPRQRARLSAMAQEQDVSVADVVRGLLCSHYKLDCPPQSFRYEPERDHGSGRLTLRLQPELWMLMKRETKGRYGALRQLIKKILDETLEA